MKINTSSWIKLREVILFLIVGVLNTAVDFAVLNLLILVTHHDQGWWLLPFDALSFLAAVVNSYVLNKHFTFRDRGSAGKWRFLRFVAVNAVGLVVNTLTVWGLSPVLQVMFPSLVAINLSKVLATFLSLCWNYFAIKRWIFPRNIPIIVNNDEEQSLVPIGVVMESETKSAL